ncbi:MAG TPA: hypothetical protein PK348_02980, partial [Spirochaetota bacterium]|nr:hypothetical protein [Spirochaetota bacterium]
SGYCGLRLSPSATGVTGYYIYIMMVIFILRFTVMLLGTSRCAPTITRHARGCRTAPFVSLTHYYCRKMFDNNSLSGNTLTDLPDVTKRAFVTCNRGIVFIGACKNVLKPRYG